MTVLGAAKKIAGAAVTAGAVWKVIGGQVVRDERGVVQRVSALGLDIFDRRRMDARRARRAARKAGRHG